MIIAITGGTGFVGGHVIDRAVAAGHQVRALTRRAQQPRDGITWIDGSLDDAQSLGGLVESADAVIHVAGVVNAPDRAGFAAGNVEGTSAIVAATASAGISRFVHVSSLAAREPALSSYGWSKAEADRLVTESALEWDIVRPPAIYGAGDREMLDLFRLARRGIALLPPGGRLSVIEVGDLARLLLTLAETPATLQVYEADDGTTGGWSHRDFARMIGAAVGRNVATIALPRPVLSLGARIDRFARGAGAKLTADRVAYFCHPDWVAAPDRRPPPELWMPRVAIADGLAATAAWYRANGLL